MRLSRMLYVICCAQFIGCAPIRVITHLNEKADFSKFTTFKTVNDIERVGSNETYSEYLDLDRAIARKMTERKYQEDPDAHLGVHYRIILNKKTDYNYDPSRTYADPYMGAYTTRKYTEGVLIIEMRDRSTRKVVWQASLDLKINRRKDIENVIDQTIDYIFREYPFEAGSNKRISPQN